MLSVLALAVECAVDVAPAVMEAIVRVESRGNPYALSVNGDVELVHQPRDQEEAVAMARWLEKHGYSFDAGLAQVNVANWARLGLDAVSVFEPCANLRAASRLFRECHERAIRKVGDGAAATAAALSCYNTGDLMRGVANGYADAVLAMASRPLVPAAGPLKPPGVTRSSRAAATAAPKAKSHSPEGRRVRPCPGATKFEEVFGKHLEDVFGAIARTKRVKAVADSKERTIQ